jgi:RNA polymerase sigma-70 factor, ECF subfamily
VVGQEPDPLVHAARRGDQDAWRQLYVLNAKRLVLWLRWLPRMDVASSPEDVAAQAWLTAASKIHDFRGSDDDFAGWLFGIARKHAANEYRRGVRRGMPLADVADTENTLFLASSDETRRVDDREATRRLLAQLSPREADVVVCVDIVGLDVRSTAVALGMKPTAVRVARHRALTRLRRLLDEQVGGTAPTLELRDCPDGP